MRKLENLEVIQSPTHGLTVLRKWERHKQRAQELKLVTPDPSVLVKAVLKSSEKVVNGDALMSFKVQLMRTQLELESQPNRGEGDAAGEVSDGRVPDLAEC